MKAWLILHIGLILILAGCASEPLQLPRFEEAKRASVELSDPTEYPVLCEIPDWNTECWQAFVVFEEIAEGNKELAQLNADIARDSDQAYDAILGAARKQQEIGMIREEMLQMERKDKFWTEVKYLGVIAVGIIGIAL